MKTICRARLLLSFCLVMSVTILLSSCSKQEAPALVIGTGGMQGSYFNSGLTIANVVNENRGGESLRLKAELSSGSVANINSISAGESAFGFAQADHQYDATNGLGHWSTKGPQEDLRAVFNIYVESVTLVAGADSGIGSIRDLRGKVVDIGSPESGTRRNAVDALRAAGLDWRTDIQAREESLDDRLAMFMRGELDAFFYTVAHPNRDIKFATFSMRGARLVPLDNVEEIVATESFYVRELISGETYPNSDGPAEIETLGVNATLLASANVSEDVVYLITKATFENLDSLDQFGANFSALVNGKALDSLMVPIHPGALRYYHEIGLEIPER
jgi:TRAP transporter TAXI family solute receptor